MALLTFSHLGLSVPYEIDTFIILILHRRKQTLSQGHGWQVVEPRSADWPGQVLAALGLVKLEVQLLGQDSGADRREGSARFPGAKSRVPLHIGVVSGRVSLCPACPALSRDRPTDTSLEAKQRKTRCGEGLRPACILLRQYDACVFFQNVPLFPKMIRLRATAALR